METNSSSDLLKKLTDLNPDIKYDYFGIEVNNLVFLTIDRNKFVSLLIRTEDRISYKMSTDLISLSLSESCTVTINNKPMASRCHVMCCKTASDEITKSFLALCQAFAVQINVTKNSNHVIEFFSNLTQLFKITPSMDLTLERQGLWGELFVIQHSQRIKSFVTFWHNETNRKFDFSKENLRLEVKTTTNSNRIHIFSHNQLYRNDQVQIIIASIMLKYDDAGLSLRELINDIRESLHGDIDLLYKLEKAVRKAGMLDQHEVGPTFDVSYAKDQLYWFNCRDVPRFNQFEPEGVSNTKYSVDITNSSRLSEEWVGEWLSAW
ncbi:PD-(D/E)XK motif protein [Cohnella sp. JJ-181]|uniref:PD-(D/E)XK motif protein n=1 Tax=Cohnella rhizoplanae TaxID=2974897 RepID=UPI0022FF6567|nr:PD-(D/E)XK motif protein [Cohnella sp. JJ-181]CAI6083998.1 hypothetical protein COHCIP112018_04192 [Cohnella sp. JJ-181]